MSMSTTPQSGRRRSRSDLVHLRSLPSAQPATKIGQVTCAWGEIEAGLAAGMKLKEVWEAARKDGIDTSYAQFRVYIFRLRCRRQRSSTAPFPPPAVGNGASSHTDSPQRDPFSNLREQRERKKVDAGFEYDPFSINRNLIDLLSINLEAAVSVKRRNDVGGRDCRFQTGKADRQMKAADLNRTFLKSSLAIPRPQAASLFP
jgi:hypothetical protein